MPKSNRIDVGVLFGFTVPFITAPTLVISAAARVVTVGGATVASVVVNVWSAPFTVAGTLAVFVFFIATNRKWYVVAVSLPATLASSATSAVPLPTGCAGVE